MNRDLLEKLKQNESFLSFYSQGMSLLYQSGIFDFLRDNGRVVQVSPELENYVDFQAANANWSAGYNHALDHILFFRELFLDPVRKEVPEMTFGSVESTLAKGDLTEAEVDAIKRGSTVDYSEFIKRSTPHK